MSALFSKALTAAILRILRPLVRILLRNGVSYGAFDELARWVYADVALKEFNLQGRKPSVSRASIISGLSRKEIVRLLEEVQPSDVAETERYSRAASVISGWRRDSQFCDRQGQPLDLSLEGGSASFVELTKKYSRDVTPRAMLDELVRVNAVEWLENGVVRLVSEAYVPQGDDAAKLEILGTDVSLLVKTIDHNLCAQEPLFQRKLAYDNLPQEVLQSLRQLSSEQAQNFLEQLQPHFSEHDRDIHAKVGGTGRKRAGIGVYYFEEDVLPSSERGKS